MADDLDTGSDFGSVSWVPSGFAGWGNEMASAGAAWDAAVNGAFYQNAANAMGGAVSPSGQTYTPTNTGIAELPLSVDPSLLNIIPGTLPGDGSAPGAANIQVTLGFDASSGAWSPDQALLTASVSAGLGAELWSVAPSVQSAVTWGTWDAFLQFSGANSQAYIDGLLQQWRVIANGGDFEGIYEPSLGLEVASGLGSVAGFLVEATSAGLLGIAAWQLFNIDVGAISEIYDRLNPTLYDSPPLSGAPFSDGGSIVGG
jgi:hypothetical protein